jgi:predicted AlkP superfamily pyrophosphatase or phosphodiesterase
MRQENPPWLPFEKGGNLPFPFFKGEPQGDSAVRRSGLAWILVIALVVLAPPASATDRTVIVLLFDGWAPALVDSFATPNLDRMRHEGSWTHSFVPEFPTISLVNQISVSTGCFPVNHGIVSNEFRDPERGRYDHSQDPDWLTGCEHLHQTAERQGLKAGVLGWVGRHSETRGPQASIVSPETRYDQFPQDPQRAEEVIALLRLPESERPRLILAYFRGPDAAAHFSGMDSDETRAAVERSDAAVGSILSAIGELPWREQVAVMVTTDHGMMPISSVVNIRKILLNQGIEAEAISSGTSSFIYLNDTSKIDEAHARLSAYEEFDVVRRESVPEHWNIGRSRRVGDLIVSARPPYFIEDLDSWPSWLQWLGTWGPEFLWARMSLKATHGYPASEAPVNGILYAWGSGIAAGRAVASMSVIDVHPTVCHLLGIQPGSPVDGTVAKAMLATAE